jgi:hypothetical protein
LGWQALNQSFCFNRFFSAVNVVDPNGPLVSTFDDVPEIVLYFVVFLVDADFLKAFVFLGFCCFVEG